MSARVFLQIPLLMVAVSSVAQTIVAGTVHGPTDNPVPGAVLRLHSSEGRIGLEVASDCEGKFLFVSLPAGAFTLTTQASGYYASSYTFVLRPRQTINLSVELQERRLVQQEITVPAMYRTVDPEKTGTSYTFTHRELESLPDPLIETTNSLVSNLMPGASQSHDNFVNVRGNEFSLHEFINGVSFLDNAQPQFSPGVSPQSFEAVSLMTGGFTPEYGNRFGGVLDITTLTGADVNGHGEVNLRGATNDNYDLNADYGGIFGRLEYYFFADGFTSGRYLDPPKPEELYDFGEGLRGTIQLDWRAKARDHLSLLMIGAGANFQQPNLTEDQEAGRAARRHLRQQTAILNWVHTFAPDRLLSTSLYQRIGSDRILPTTDPITPYSTASRSPLTIGVKSDFSQAWHGHLFKTGVDLTRLRELESFFFDGRGDPDVFLPFRGGVTGGQASLYAQDHFSPLRNLAIDAGVRYDYFDLVDTHVQNSPRIGIAYHIPRTRSVMHAAYNRFFSPPPIEYSLLASFIGNKPIDPTQRAGNVRAYTQNYFEAGWAQELRSRMSLELNTYLHTGHNSFENHEISITRLFVPLNFHSARSEGAELVLNVQQLERLGISGRFAYAVGRTFFTAQSLADSPVTSRLVRERGSCRHSTRHIPGPHRSPIVTAGVMPG